LNLFLKKDERLSIFLIYSNFEMFFFFKFFRKLKTSLRNWKKIFLTAAGKEHPGKRGPAYSREGTG